MREFYEETGFCNAPFSCQHVLSGTGNVALENQNGEKREGWVSTSALGVASLYLSLFLARALSLSLAHTLAAHRPWVWCHWIFLLLSRALFLSKTHAFCLTAPRPLVSHLSVSLSLSRGLVLSHTNTNVLCSSHTNSLSHTHTHSHAAHRPWKWCLTVSLAFACQARTDHWWIEDVASSIHQVMSPVLH